MENNSETTTGQQTTVENTTTESTPGAETTTQTKSTATTQNTQTAPVEKPQVQTQTTPQGEVVYEFKQLEGMKISPDYLEGLKTFAKSQKLAPEQAQAILDREYQFAIKTAEIRDQQIGQWEESIKNDKVLGG